MASVPLTPAGVLDEGSGRPLMTPNESPRSSSPQPRKDDEIVRVAKRLYSQAKRYRSKYDSKWDEYWDYYRGKQWPVKRQSGKASPNCNIIASVINTIVPIMTDTSPSFGVVARDPKDYKFAELLTNVLKSWWDRREMNHVLVEALMDALVTDVGVLKVSWDDELNDGLGDVDVTVVDPKRIYVSPTCQDFDRSCRWVIHEFYRSRGSLALRFPDNEARIRDATSASQSSEDRSTEDTRVRLVSPIDKDVDAPDNADVSTSHNDDIRVWELWMQDDTVVTEEVVNEGSDGKYRETITRKKYPHGRLVTLLPDSGVVLQDVPNPYRDGEMPFVRIVDMLVPRSFWGMGEVSGISETQRMINKAWAVIMDWCNLMSNPSWIVDADSGVDPEMLTNEVGQIITCRKGSRVDRLPAPPVPPQLFEMYHTLVSLLDTQSGVHDVTQGRKPTGITAAQAIETLQEAAQTRVRLKERNLVTSLTRLGRLIVSRMLQYYTEPRVIRIGGNGFFGAWPKYVRFFVEAAQGTYVPTTQDIEYDEGAGAYVERPPVTGNESVGDFDLDVTSGTSLPLIKAERSQQAMRLWESKAIDRKALLDQLDWPDKEEILNRLTQEEQAQQQVSQQAAPQQGGM